MTKGQKNPSSYSRTLGRRLRRRRGQDGGGREAEAITMAKVENQIEDTGTAVTGASKAGEGGRASRADHDAGPGSGRENGDGDDLDSVLPVGGRSVAGLECGPAK